MEKFKVSFEANNQQLKSIGTKHASDTYADIEATFVLGEKWTDMDSVSAVWWNDFTRVATVLDSQGKCIVPHEVLERKGYVRVNLVGSVVENGELVTRLTSYSAEAVKVNEKIKLTGSETSEITPSQYEQFVASVKTDADRAEAGATASANSAQNASESATASANSASDSAQSATASAESAQNASGSAQSAENAKDDAEDARDEILGMRATAETLEAGSDATASYSDGLLTLGIPRGDQGIQGIQGETGATPSFSIGTVETLEPTEDATATITGTAENPVLNLGIPKGEQGDVNLSQLEALLPTDTASGSIVTITDGQAIVPAKSLKVQLEPIQDLNGYDKPWSGGAGKNKLDVTQSEQGGIDASGNLVDGANLWRSTNYIPVTAGNSYTFSSQSAYTLRIYWYDASKAFMNRVEGASPFTSVAPTNAAYIKWTIYSTADLTEAIVASSKLQIEEGSSATSYEPYSNICPISGRTEVKTIVSPTTSATDGRTYTTSLGQTVYGGVLDVVSGELVVDRAMADLGSLEWTWLYAWYQTTIDNMKYVSSNTEVGNGISSQYTMRKASGFSSAEVGQMAIDTANFKVKTAGEGITPSGQLVYPLANPQTIQLTPQKVQLLLGTNNVWSDGDVTIVYNADIQRYIDKKLSGNSTTSMLSMSRPMVQTETTETEETETETAETE